MAGFVRRWFWRTGFRKVLLLYFLFLALLLILWKLERKTHLPIELLNNESYQTDKSVYQFENINCVRDSRKGSSVFNENINISRGFKLGPLDEKFQQKYFGRREEFCKGGFIGVNSLLAFLRNVTIYPKYGHGRKGGEDIMSVVNQAENDEYFKFDKGYFSMNCSDPISYRFTSKSHLNTWTQALQTESKVPKGVKVISDWTIAVMRYEYANLYFNMMDIYATFLVAKSFKLDLISLSILWIDGHPCGAMDNSWNLLFGNVTRAGELQHPVLYRNMVWGIMGYSSPLRRRDLPVVPYLEEFRSFVLTRHGISDQYKLDCKRLNVLFIWRRDYLAHPRNPSGKISRKIKNEDELIASVKDILPTHQVTGEQIDKFTMEQQLQIVSTTDILIGMHGAGLSHTLFLPKHAGLVEIYPKYWSAANKSFRMIAKWRKLHYATWINTDHAKELPNHYTVVDVKPVLDMVHATHYKLCGEQTDV